MGYHQGYQHCRCDLEDRYWLPSSRSCQPCPSHVDCSPWAVQPMHNISQGYYPLRNGASLRNTTIAASLIAGIEVYPCYKSSACNPPGGSVCGSLCAKADVSACFNRDSIALSATMSSPFYARDANRTFFPLRCRLRESLAADAGDRTIAFHAVPCMCMPCQY